MREGAIKQTVRAPVDVSPVDGALNTPRAAFTANTSLLYKNAENTSVLSCLSVIMVSRSITFQPRLAAWVEGGRHSRTRGLTPRRVMAVAC